MNSPSSEPISQIRRQAIQQLLNNLAIKENASEETYALIDECLTHSSYKADSKGSSDYERLEFFGDSVLKFVISEYLFKRFPNYSEGRLTEIRAVLVSGKTLEELGNQLDLGPLILLGRGIRLKPSMVARSMEAIFGAVYFGCGWQTVYELIVRLLGDKAEQIHEHASKDNYKARLQELTQSRGQGVPNYAVVSVEGPAHSPVFQVTVSILGKIIASGSGHSKKIAEQQAAQYAFNEISTYQE